MQYADLYASFWHHPFACWLAAALLALVLSRRMVFFHAYLMWGILITAADAMITGGWSQLGGEAHRAYLPLALLFVVLGDLRYYLLVHRWSAHKPDAPGALYTWGSPGMWLKVLGWSLTPSLIIQTLQWLTPRAFQEPRVTYLIYELCALVIAVMFRLLLIPRMAQQQSAGIQKWLKAVSVFIILQYGGWATADMIILSGHAWGHAARIVPNVMYYALFLPAVLALAPREEIELERA